MQPIIGITMGLKKTGMSRDNVPFNFIWREYGEQVRSAGGQPIFIDNTIDPATAAQLCDGIIISGGEDIDPAVYGQDKIGTGEIEPVQRTEWERRLIDACDQQSVRILGVCYGSQLLNVHYGGTLFQDVATQHGATLSHGSSYGSVRQRVTFNENFLSFESEDSVETAHRHHQAVQDLAPGFRAAAYSEDGLIEAIAGRGHFGIQWHAESDGTAPLIYGAFVSLCSSQSSGQAVALRPVHEV